MKAFATALLALVAASSMHAAPVAKISTLTGKTYRQCEIVKVHPDGVSFTHANGAAKVLFTDLASEWRARLGYDPAKARAYEREQQEKREAQAEARRKHEQQRGEALLMAQQIELARLRGIEAQARAAQQAAASGPNPNVSVVPVLPALGAVHDSRYFSGAGYRDRGFDGFSPYGYGFGGYGYRYPAGWSLGGRYCAPHGHSHSWGGGVNVRAGGTNLIIRR